MSQNNSFPSPIIHIGKYYHDGQWFYLFLRQTEENHYVWFEEKDQKETRTPIEGSTTEEALLKAHKNWKLFSFQTVICGFRYTLPERDEHGINALFCEMVQSYSSPNGVYMDPKLGHQCHVLNASHEALDLWKTLKETNRMGV